MNPTTKSKEQVLTESTNAAQQAAGMIGGTFEQAKGFTAAPITANNVPMSNLATTPPSVNMPTPTPQSIDTTVMSEGGKILDGFAQSKEAEAAQAGQKYSASEQKLREQFGILGTESQTRSQMEEKAGVNAFSQDLTKFQEQLRRQMASLDQFDLDNVNTIESMRVDASKRDITKRTFGAMSAEANIQMAVERAGKVASTRATIAAMDITQGNLKGATEQVDKALKAVYDPVRMGIQMESQFLQNNLSLFNTAQTSAANARMKVMEQEVKEIDRAISLVDSAVMSGYANGEDIQKMTSLSGNPQEQAQYAQNIVAKGARESVMLANMSKRASITASNMSTRKSLLDMAVLGDPSAIAELGFDPMASQKAEVTAQENRATDKAVELMDKKIAQIDKLLSMEGAIKNSSGSFQNATIAGLVPRGDTFGTLDGKFTSGIQGSIQARNEKNEFLAEINNLLINEGFTKFTELADAGVKLTPISNAEIELIMNSSGSLMSAGTKKDGQVTGFGPDHKFVTTELVAIRESVMNLRNEQLAIQKLGYEGYLELLEMQRLSQ